MEVTTTRFKEFKAGLVAGFPIMLGYLSVSFGVGILACKAGMSPFQAALMSLTNLTSAGEAAGVEIIAASGTMIEMAFTQLVINFRYVLMGISLTQRADRSFSFGHRLIAAYGITDEIFALMVSGNKKAKPFYMYGLIVLPMIGWTVGTLLGAIAGQILPQSVTNALGILLYGMFVAILVPPAKADLRIACAVISAAAFSGLFRMYFPRVTSGVAVIVAALGAAMLCAAFFPVTEKTIEEEGGKR